MSRKVILLFFFLLILSASAFAKVFYVAPKGSNTNAGTIAAPFLTIQRAQEAVSPGDTVYIRGGLYSMSEAQIARYGRIWAYVTYLDKSGSPGARINYWAYPGEQPVFDYQHVKPANRRINAFQVMGDWLHIKGIEVIGVQVTIKGHTQSICFENKGSNNIYEQLSMHDGQAIGFYLLSGSNNLVLNCDAYRNYDYTSEGGRGGNVDGFGNHPKKGDVNNVFRGCRAWFNSDDGYDCINAHESTVFENCWAFYNGYSTDFASLADGNGFKVGGYGGTAFDQLPNPIPRNTTQFCLAVRNKASGFYANHHLAGGDWFHNSAYMNAVNYNMLNRKAVTREDYKEDVPGYGHVLKNNLGFVARRAEVDNLNAAACDISGNYFNLPVTVSSDDFISLEQSLLTAPRKPDGSLPDIDFMLLVPGSDLIDAGVEIGFPFYGAAPDLGYRELQPKP